MIEYHLYTIILYARSYATSKTCHNALPHKNLVCISELTDIFCSMCALVDPAELKKKDERFNPLKISLRENSEGWNQKAPSPHTKKWMIPPIENISKGK